MDKLVLFDMDKTLLVSSIEHRRAFSEGFRRVYGVEANTEEIAHTGLTDKQVMLEVMKNRGLDEATILAKLEECAQVTVEAFNATFKDASVLLLDGVAEMLRELDKSGVMVGVVTGNLEPIARARLKRAGIERYIKVGGFGSDDMSRAELVRIAIRRAQGKGFGPGGRVVLVGDTPRDVAAGKEAGVRTIAVATGLFTREQLQDAGADLVLDSFKDTAEVLRALDVR